MLLWAFGCPFYWDVVLPYNPGCAPTLHPLALVTWVLNCCDYWCVPLYIAGFGILKCPLDHYWSTINKWKLISPCLEKCARLRKKCIFVVYSNKNKLYFGSIFLTCSTASFTEISEEFSTLICAPYIESSFLEGLFILHYSVLGLESIYALIFRTNHSSQNSSIHLNVSVADS
jgi:hypothetical protein